MLQNGSVQVWHRKCLKAIVLKLCKALRSMNQPSVNLIRGISSLLLLCAVSAKAVPVTVSEVGIGANEVVNITSSTLNGGSPVNVYAGIVKLTVNGIPTDGFCIDPFHWSVSGPQSYDSEPLADGPKPPGGAMGSLAATYIEKLWTQLYSPTMNNATAAELQIAIWDVIASDPASKLNNVTFTVNGQDYGGAAAALGIQSDTTTVPANLMAVSGPSGQDYVVPNSGGGGSVPDGGTTIMLLGGSLCGLACMRRKLCTQ